MKLSAVNGWPIGGVWAMEPTAFYDALSALDRMDFTAHLADWHREQKASLEKDVLEGKSGDGGSSSESPLYGVEDGVAILALEGPMTKKPTFMSRYFGGTSTLEVQHALRKAGQDPAVKGILLVIDSPGGHIDGTAELADEVSRVNKLKPVDVYADGTCCSAAMWVASQARTITAPRTAMVGSIGTIFSVTDSSEAAKAAGIKRHVFATDELKGGGTPGTAVTDAHKAHFQSIVQSSQVPFTAAVSQGRGLTTEQVKALGSRVFIGKKAQQSGLIDHVGSYDSALARLKRHDPATYNPNAPRGASAFESEAEDDTAPKGKEKPMKHLLAGALASLGMHTLAGKVSGVSSDADGNADPQALVSLMASETKSEVDAQVKAQMDAHPLLAACAKAEITDPAQIADLKSVAAEARTALDADVLKQAVRCFGQDAGKLKAGALKTASFVDAKTLSGLWQETADAKFGAGKDGQPAKAQLRQTGHSAIPEKAEDADGEEDDTRPAGLAAADNYIDSRYVRPDGAKSDSKALAGRK